VLISVCLAVPLTCTTAAGDKLSPAMETKIIQQFLAGNTPSWMRKLQPVKLTGGGIEITVHVSPGTLSHYPVYRPSCQLMSGPCIVRYRLFGGWL